MTRSSVVLAVTVAALAAGPAAAQHLIDTYAGGGPDGVAAISAAISTPAAVAVDGSGNLYIASLDAQRVFKVDTAGQITVLAGNGVGGFGVPLGDNGAARDATFYYPTGVAVDSSGNVFVADSQRGRIRKIDTSGTITTVAGGGANAPADGSTATDVSIGIPNGIALDGSGNIYIADTSLNRVFKVDTAGLITTVAGGGTDAAGEGIAATDAQLGFPSAVAFDGAGNVLIAEVSNSRIRKVAGGNIQTIVSTASQTQPSALAAKGTDIFFAGQSGSKVWKVDTTTTPVTITTFAGTGVAGFSGDGGPATSAKLFTQILGLATDSSGNVYIADTYNLRLRRVSAGNIATVAGNGSLFSSGDGELATKAGLTVWGLTLDASGNLSFPDDGRLRSIDAATQVIDGVAGTAGKFAKSRVGVARDTNGNYYVADSQGHRLWKVDTFGNVTAFAGTGGTGSPNFIGGFSGDGGAATAAQLNAPSGVAVDASGQVYIADTFNHRVRRVDTAGIITTVAGNGTTGIPVFNPPPSGDGGQATNAVVWNPTDVTFDAAGNLYIAEQFSHRIRKVNTTTGIITTVAAQLSRPTQLAFDKLGNLYFTESDVPAGRVARIDTAGNVTTVAAGGTTAGFTGDGGPATAATFGLLGPWGVAVDASGNVYVGDTGNHRIRRVSNRAPVADAGPDQTSAGSFTLDGSGSSDADGDALSYEWKESATTVGTSSSVALTRGVGTYTFTLTASDGFLSSSDTVTVTVTVTGSVNVNIYGAGTGTVVSDDGNISCTSFSGGTCVASYATATTVHLVATAATGSVFAGWGSAVVPPLSGDCNTTTSDCYLTASGSKFAAAKFDIATHTLSVTSGAGGSVSSDVGGINCGSACSASFQYGTAVKLTANPDLGFQFDGWSGACASAGTIPTCTLTMDANKSASATFKEIALTSFNVTPSSATIGVGQIVAFTALGTFTDGSNRALAPGSALEAGDQFTCARPQNGTVKCWGGSAGSTPATVPGISTAIGLGAGTSHACAVLAGGSVKCWGNGLNGQLGDGLFTTSASPVTVTGISSAVAVVGGSAHSCALLANGTAKCWGDNGSGQLGDSTFMAANSGTPIAVAGLSNAIALSAEGGLHTCAVLRDGAVQCWGGDGSGQLGGGGAAVTSGALVTVAGVKATAVAAGGSHTCALITDGSVKCWGNGLNGQLGNGGTPSSSSPVAVSGISSASAIAAGDFHSCAVVSGLVQCWGDNTYRQLGVSNVGSSAIPVTAAGTGTALGLAAGDLHTCAVLSNGSLQCWGANGSGQVGNGPPSFAASPAPVAGISTAVAVGWGSGDTSKVGMDGLGRAVGRAIGSAPVGASLGSFVSTAAVTVANTAAGANVTATPVDSATGATPVTLTFSNVTQAGTTSLTTSPFGPAPPATFQLGNPAVYYELSTTATYSGSITICIDFTGINFGGATPQLQHYENGGWVPVLTTTTNNVICGSVTSLSPFALFVPKDTTAPVIASASASPNVLGPPNHAMVPVAVTVSVSDDRDPAPKCEIASVTSNELVNGLGDGDTAPDWRLNGGLALELRAERAGGGAGRIYTIEIGCTDASRNRASRSVTVLVPKDRRK